MPSARLLVLSLLLLATRSVRAGVEFAKAPQAMRSGDTITITFTLSAATDVEVAILDAMGNIARNVAAGVLGGKNPPPAPLAAGLAQRLTWDGKNDLGEAAAGGPFQARVRAGTSVGFGRFLGDSPYTGSVVSMP